MDALLIIDVQNDFCAGGALEVAGGDEVIPEVNRLAEQADFVVATRDWHPADHGSFDREGGPWPPHCIQGTPGAELHPDLDRSRIDVIVDAGYERDKEGYSGFEGTNLRELLEEREVREVHIAGLALDVCVRATALEARQAGFDVTLHRNATRAVDVRPGDGDRTVEELIAAGVTVEP